MAADVKVSLEKRASVVALGTTEKVDAAWVGIVAQLNDMGPVAAFGSAMLGSYDDDAS